MSVYSRTSIYDNFINPDCSENNDAIIKYKTDHNIINSKSEGYTGLASAIRYQIQRCKDKQGTPTPLRKSSGSIIKIPKQTLSPKIKFKKGMSYPNFFNKDCSRNEELFQEYKYDRTEEELTRLYSALYKQQEKCKENLKLANSLLSLSTSTSTSKKIKSKHKLIKRKSIKRKSRRTNKIL